MPVYTEWSVPEVFLKHNGVTVYHTYKNGDMNQVSRDHWFTLNEFCGECECQCGEDGDEREEGCLMVFDVGDLPWGDLNDKAAVIRAAIDANRLTVDGVKIVEGEA